MSTSMRLSTNVCSLPYARKDPTITQHCWSASAVLHVPRDKCTIGKRIFVTTTELVLAINFSMKLVTNVLAAQLEWFTTKLVKNVNIIRHVSMAGTIAKITTGASLAQRVLSLWKMQINVTIIEHVKIMSISIKQCINVLLHLLVTKHNIIMSP